MMVLVIGNPAAGRGQALSEARKLIRILESRGHEAELFSTRKPGDAARRASLVGSEVDALVIAGGDGTVNEILNGLPDPSRTPLLHLPTGTANMLSRELQLPPHTEDLARIIERGDVRWADMGIVNGRRFLLLVTCGFDAAVAYEVRKSRGEKLGYRGYLRPVVRGLRNYELGQMRVSVDGKSTEIGCHVMVLKAQNYGGLLMFSRSAALDSGRFDICVFKKGSVLSLARYCIAGLLRMNGLLRDVVYCTGKRVTIESECPCPVEVDGDYVGSTPLTIDLVEKKVPLLVGPT